MRKFYLTLLMVLVALSASAQKYVDIHTVQSRAMEPMQQVLVKPLVADLKIIKNEKVTFPPSWQFKGIKCIDIYKEEKAIENAIKTAIHEAAQREDADMIVGMNYEVRSHTENGVVNYENGIDIIISGYPAKFTNWRTFNEKEDIGWATILIDAQRVYDTDDMLKGLEDKNK